MTEQRISGALYPCAVCGSARRNTVHTNPQQFGYHPYKEPACGGTGHIPGNGCADCREADIDQQLNKVLDDILRQVVCDCGNYRHHGVDWMPEGSGEGKSVAKEILKRFAARIAGSFNG